MSLFLAGPASVPLRWGRGLVLGLLSTVINALTSFINDSRDLSSVNAILSLHWKLFYGFNIIPSL
jgi:hypothetical protein